MMELAVNAQLTFDGEEVEWRTDETDSWHVPFGPALPRLERRVPSPTGVCPFDLRWVSLDLRAAIFEVAPAERMITFTNANAYASGLGIRKVHTLFAYIPRTVIGLAMNDNSPSIIYNFIILRPIQKWDDPIFMCPMPNVYSDGHICLPSNDRRFDQRNFTDGLLSAYEAVWDTRYNTDLIDAVKLVRNGHPSILWKRMVEQYRRTSRHHMKDSRTPRGTPLQLLHQWQKLSPEEVMEIVDWSPSSFGTIGALKEHLTQYTNTNFNLHSSIIEAIR